MKRTRRILLMVLWGATAAHAGEIATFQPSDPGADDPGYFPVPAIGSVEEYAATTKSGGKTEKGTMKVTTEKEEQLQGHKYLKQKAEISGVEQGGQSASYWWYAADGIHVIEETAKEAPAYVNPPFPLSIGKEWTYVNPSLGVATRCLAETIEDVKAGDQTYKGCLKLTETTELAPNFKMIMEKWYAPKIGLVKATVKGRPEMEAEFLRVKPAAVAK